MTGDLRRHCGHYDVTVMGIKQTVSERGRKVGKLLFSLLMTDYATLGGNARVT